MSSVERRSLPPLPLCPTAPPLAASLALTEARSLARAARAPESALRSDLTILLSFFFYLTQTRFAYPFDLLHLSRFFFRVVPSVLRRLIGQCKEQRAELSLPRVISLSLVFDCRRTTSRLRRSGSASNASRRALSYSCSDEITIFRRVIFFIRVLRNFS